MRDGKRLGFEFKYSDKPSTTKSMHIALSDLNLDHLYVVHPGSHNFTLGDKASAIALPALLEKLNTL
jgi:hypothetical protein